MDALFGVWITNPFNTLTYSCETDIVSIIHYKKGHGFGVMVFFPYSSVSSFSSVSSSGERIATVDTF